MPLKRASICKNGERSSTSIMCCTDQKSTVVLKAKTRLLGGFFRIVVPGLGLTPQALNSALVALAPKG
ncbi:hypothetical protein TUM17567_49200 [Citrobacter amalonaticus]|nr:hypothetical protein TUM17567_49200 [Citrobacter amalonaticus]